MADNRQLNTMNTISIGRKIIERGIVTFCSCTSINLEKVIMIFMRTNNGGHDYGYSQHFSWVLTNGMYLSQILSPNSPHECATFFRKTPNGILFGHTEVVCDGPAGKLSKSYLNDRKMKDSSRENKWSSP